MLIFNGCVGFASATMREPWRPDIEQWAGDAWRQQYKNCHSWLSFRLQTS